MNQQLSSTGRIRHFESGIAAVSAAVSSLTRLVSNRAALAGMQRAAKTLASSGIAIVRSANSHARANGEMKDDRWANNRESNASENVGAHSPSEATSLRRDRSGILSSQTYLQPPHKLGELVTRGLHSIRSQDKAGIAARRSELRANVAAEAESGPIAETKARTVRKPPDLQRSIKSIEVALQQWNVKSPSTSRAEGAGLAPTSIAGRYEKESPESDGASASHREPRIRLMPELISGRQPVSWPRAGAKAAQASKHGRNQDGELSIVAQRTSPSRFRRGDTTYTGRVPTMLNGIRGLAGVRRMLIQTYHLPAAADGGEADTSLVGTRQAGTMRAHASASRDRRTKAALHSAQTLNYAPTVNINATLDDRDIERKILAGLLSHGRELSELIRREAAKYRRTEF